jgi:hypothetical protein
MPREHVVGEAVGELVEVGEVDAVHDHGGRAYEAREVKTLFA